MRATLGREALWSAKWFGPHIAIWGATVLYVWSALGAGSCTGLCGVTDGFMVYSVLVVAMTVSALIAAIQLYLVVRHLPPHADHSRRIQARG